VSATCKSCGAPIRWAKTVSGKSMPVDVEPAANGNVVFLDDKTVIVSGPRARIEGDERRYTSHFATCPQASQHRRRP
jgi:hypothetical protein